MSFLELASARWTCRKYDPRPVEQEKVDAILEAIRVAPTAKNAQPQRVFLLQSEDAMERVRQCTPCTYGSPIAFIIAYDPEACFVRDDNVSFGEIDATIAATHLMLEAYDQGLGSTWIGAYDAAKLHELFPEIEGLVDISLFAVGYPADDAQPAPPHSASLPLEQLVKVL